MHLSVPTAAPKSESALLQRCRIIEGWTFQQLAHALRRVVPINHVQRKGWLGQAIEVALGSSAGSLAEPDFYQLGIELKTLPLNHHCQPSESTYVSTINLLQLTDLRWEQSSCYKKLQRILWVPIEGCRTIPYMDRRIGRAFLWSPTAQQAAVLRTDWEEHIENIVCGRLDSIDARKGQFLQVRPKASNAKSLCFAFDAMGNKIQTLPRGFYLRSLFTQMILNNCS